MSVKKFLLRNQVSLVYVYPRITFNAFNCHYYINFIENTNTLSIIFTCIMNIIVIFASRKKHFFLLLDIPWNYLYTILEIWTKEND